MRTRTQPALLRRGAAASAHVAVQMAALPAQMIQQALDNSTAVGHHDDNASKCTSVHMSH